MDHVLADPSLSKKLGSLDAMLVGILFKIYVVEQTHDAPKIGIVSIAEIVCKPSHNTFDGQTMLNVESLAVVLFQKLKRTSSRDLSARRRS